MAGLGENAEGSSVDAIEKAIRSALEKGNADDRAFREKVYRSAFSALDRALQANPNVTVEVAINRRKAVQAKIAEIESEFLPAVPDVGAPNGGEVEAPAVDPAASPKSGSTSSPAVSVDGPADAPRSRVLPVVPDIMPDGPLPEAPSLDTRGDAQAGAEVAPDRDERRIRGPRLPLTAIFLGVTLLAAIAIGGYFAMQTGVFKTAAQLDTAPPQPPPTVSDDEAPAQDGAPQKPGEPDQSRDWINVFSPNDPTHVSAPSDAKADVMKDDTGSFLRIRSGASGSAVSFDVGQGIRTAVLVEGTSDKVAVETLARGRGVDLGRVAVVALGGVTNAANFLALVDTRMLRVAGLCDVAERRYFDRVLETVFVCDPDLEGEFIRALGIEGVEAVVEGLGQLHDLRVFQNQPFQRERPAEDQLRRFMGTTSGRKALYARALAEALGTPPPPLEALLDWI